MFVFSVSHTMSVVLFYKSLCLLFSFCLSNHTSSTNSFEIALHEATRTPHVIRWCSSDSNASTPIGRPPSIDMVSSGQVQASLSALTFRDPDVFVAGEIHRHVPFWHSILHAHAKRCEISSYIDNGVAVHSFLTLWVLEIRQLTLRLNNISSLYLKNMLRLGQLRNKRLRSFLINSSPFVPTSVPRPYPLPSLPQLDTFIVRISPFSDWIFTPAIEPLAQGASRDGFLFNHSFGKTLRVKTTTFSLLSRVLICPVADLKLYVPLADRMGIQLRHGYLFRSADSDGASLLTPFKARPSMALFSFAIVRLFLARDCTK